MSNQFNEQNNEKDDHLVLGSRGEILAAEYLRQHGYRLVATNFTTPIGYSLSGRQITGEIDLIAYDETQIPYILTFIEVKTRTRVEVATPQAAVDRQKQRHIIKAARIYRRLLRLESEPFRYDVVSVVLVPKSPPQITLLSGFFSEQTFAKSHWQRRAF
jgi:putative endonuclease